MLAIERVIDAIARQLGLDPLDVRKANLYRSGGDVTPYGQTVEDHDVIHRLIEELERTSDYRRRRKNIEKFNASSPILKRGIALTPVKFGISFTLAALNQAGALVHVYQDGSVHLNHGGTEMGQGLFQKVAQIAAEEFGIGLERVRITATSTDKVPNTSPTAASAGTDLNGMAVQIACREIKARLAHFAAATWNVSEDNDRISRRPGFYRKRERLVRRAREESLWRARASVRGRLLQDPEAALGPRQGEGQTVPVLCPWRGLQRGRSSMSRPAK